MPRPLPPLTPPRSFSMDDVVALERLATLHGAFVDDASRVAGVESFCQLCLKTLDDASTTAAPGRACPSGHGCCLSCASVLNPDDARAPWSPRAGCPACHADDTDDGMTRLFARPEPRGAPLDDRPRRHPLAPLLIRDALTADDADALAGVLVAERRAAFIALDDPSSSPTPSSSSSSDAAWPPWDCGAQLRSAFASLPSAADAARAFPGGVLDLALVSNGSALLGGSLGIRIDAHATVVRFNEYECGGVYASDVGRRVDAHATGWLTAASRDDPRVDRLCAEDPPDDDADHESAPESALPTAEVRLMPNVEGLGRAYYASYLCAVATHRRTRWRDAEDWWRRRRGPVAFVVAPTAYGRYWRHVRDTGAVPGADPGADSFGAGAGEDDDDGEVFPARTTARVTSGYSFALVALDLTGQPLPGEWSAETEGEKEKEGFISRSSRAASSSSSSSSSSPMGRVTLYGFEDDARNARDPAGGHFFDDLHRQAHHLYDFPWERAAMATMARARGPERFRRVTVFADE